MWADRITGSAIAGQLVAAGLSTPEELDGVAEAWHAWAEHPDGWIMIPHGELLIKV
jgi:hypothetical protein